MRRTLAVLLVVTAALPAPVSASHSQDTLPALAGEPSTDEGLAWLGDRVLEAGCARPAYGDGCSMANTKWFTITAAHAGLDPATWPNDGGSILGYLEDHVDDLWDAEAEGCDCPRQKVLSLAKSILAFRAAGQDPSQLAGPDGDPRDLVDDLLAYFDGSQFGRTEAVNDDIWAVIALNSHGYTGPEVADALDRIASAQRPDGGVPHEVTSTSASTDTTAAAVMAAAPHGRAMFLDNARSYLVDAQIQDDDGRACWPNQPSLTNPSASPESTSWALQAVVALGEDPLAWSVDDRSPIRCLLAFQNEDGGFGPSASNTLATYQAVTALAWAPYGSLQGPTETLQVSQSTEEGKETTTSLPTGFLRIGDQAEESVTWTPQDPGTRTFHGVTWDPHPRPAAVHVTIQAASEEPQENDGTDTGDGQGAGEASSEPPTADLSPPATAERNVATEITVQAEPADTQVVAYRLDWGDGPPTPWSDQPTFEHRYQDLGEHTLQAWAKDADGDVSQAATAGIDVVDAAPRLTVDGSGTIHRHDPLDLTAQATDPDGPAPEVTWSWLGGQANGTEVTITLAHPGTTSIAATASDQAGNTAKVLHDVHVLNRPPEIAAIGPLTAEANATHTLTIEATDPEGDDLTITWSEPDRTSYGGQYHLETGAPGQRTLTVDVNDPYGGWATATVTLEVAEDPDQADAEAPTVQTGARSPDGGDQTDAEDSGSETQRPTVQLPSVVRGQAGTATLIDGSATDPDSAVTAVEVVLDGPVPVRGTSSFQALLPALPEGSYNLSARAADDIGWGPWTTTTLLVEDPSSDRSEGDDQPLTELGGPVAQTADEIPIPQLTPLLMGLAALLAARRRYV